MRDDTVRTEAYRIAITQVVRGKTVYSYMYVYV